MATCKDCLHYDVCTIIENSVSSDEDYLNEFGCDDFKDRTKWIELPCNVGDTVYYIEMSEDFDKFYVSAEKATELRLNEHGEWRVLAGCILFDWGKNGNGFFLTREEAEKALQKRSDPE